MAKILETDAVREKREAEVAVYCSVRDQLSALVSEGLGLRDAGLKRTANWMLDRANVMNLDCIDFLLQHDGGDTLVTLINRMAILSQNSVRALENERYLDANQEEIMKLYPGNMDNFTMVVNIVRKYSNAISGGADERE